MTDYDELAELQVRHLLKSGSCSGTTLMGCSDEEIAKLEREHALELPKAYRAFLSKMGREAGDFFRGTDWEYDALFEHRQMAVELIDLHVETLSLPPNAFVYAFHQGYTFLFFLCDGADDPEVFNYLEGSREFTKVAGCFTEWFVGVVSRSAENARWMAATYGSGWNKHRSDEA